MTLPVTNWENNRIDLTITIIRGEINMKKATIQLEALTCPSCMQKIDNAVKSLDGVEKESVNVLFNSSKVKLSFDEEKISVDKIENAITALGYEVIKSQVKDA
jgi:copper chaperone